MFSDSSQLPPVHEAWLPREHALHRPRHGGRQLVALICALIFFATPTALWAIGMRPAEIENHKLASFPSVSDGWGLFTGLPQWAVDQLVFRGAAIDAADGISRGVFGEPPPFGAGQQPSGPLPGTAPHPSKDSSGGYRQVIEGDDGWLYLGDDVRGKCHPRQPLKRTIAGLNELRKAVESSGREFLLVVAPDKTTMAPQHLPDSYAGKECAAAFSQKLWPQLVNDAQAVDLRPLLETAASNIGRPVYYPNDTHWTDEGSVAMTMSLVENLRPGLTEGWAVTPTDSYTSSADLPTMIGRTGSKTTVRYSLMPDGQTNRTGQLALNIDKPLHRKQPAIAGVVPERTLVFGDSFTKAASGYLSAGFSDVTVLSYTTAGEAREATIDAFVKSEIIVVQIVERALAAGTASFLYDDFTKQLAPRLAAQPVG